MQGEVRDTILVDECLSVAPVAVAKARGIAAVHAAVHAAHIGKGGWQDWNRVPSALANGDLVATNDRRHFLREYLTYDLHNGLIILVPNVERDDQIALFQNALDAVLALDPDVAHPIVEVLAEGSVPARPWASEEHDLGHFRRPTWT